MTHATEELSHASNWVSTEAGRLAGWGEAGGDESRSRTPSGEALRLWAGTGIFKLSSLLI